MASNVNNGLNIKGDVTLAGGNISGSNIIGSNQITTSGVTLSGGNITANDLNVSEANITVANIDVLNTAGVTISGSEIIGTQATITNIDASNVTSTTISGQNVTADNLYSPSATITSVTSTNVTSDVISGGTINTPSLNADSGNITILGSTSANVTTLSGGTINTGDLNATGGSISGMSDVTATTGTFDNLNVNQDITMSGGSITGAGIVSADQLFIGGLPFSSISNFADDPNNTATGALIGDVTNNVASGEFSVAEGDNTTALGDQAHAEGANTTAEGFNSHAEGWYSHAQGWHSHAEGRQTSTFYAGAHAEGRETLAYGYYSHAEGYKTTAHGNSSHAQGLSTTAMGDRSHAGGENAKAMHDNSFVWSDGANMVSQGINTFNVHASGGFHISGGDLIVNGQTIDGSIDLSAVNQNIVPVSGGTFSLGTSGASWKEIYTDNNIYFGTDVISVSAGKLYLNGDEANLDQVDEFILSELDVDISTTGNISGGTFYGDGSGLVGAGGITYSVITGDTNAVSRYGYLVDLSGGSVTVTMPLSASEGDMVGIVDATGDANVNSMFIDFNGENFHGSAGNLEIDVPRAGLVLVYANATQGWVISSEIATGTVFTVTSVEGLSGGNILTDVSVSGNISGASFYGDASNLTNLPQTVTSVEGLSGGNIITDVLVTGNISGSAFYGDGSNLTGIQHLTTVDGLSGGTIVGNISAGAFYGDGSQLTGITDNFVTSVDGLSGGNILTDVSVAGNISGSVFYGDGSQLTGITDNFVTSVDGLSGGTIVGNISAGAFYGDGTTLTGLFDPSSVGEHIIPAVSGAYDLGSPSHPWRELYLTDNSLYLGNNVISMSGGEFQVNGVTAFTVTSTPTVYAQTGLGNTTIFSDTTSWGFGLEVSSISNGTVGDDAVGTVISSTASTINANLNSWVTAEEKTVYVTTSVNTFSVFQIVASATNYAFVSDGTTTVNASTEYVYKTTLPVGVTITDLNAVSTAGDFTFRTWNGKPDTNFETFELPPVTVPLTTEENISAGGFYGPFHGDGSNITGLNLDNITDGPEGGVLLGDVLTNTVSGSFSIAEGKNTTATGIYSHAEGKASEALGETTHAEGNYTTAIGEASHSEGSGTTATGDYSHAEGVESKAYGEASHAEGTATRAVGNYSHAEGGGSTASGMYAHSEGRETTASGHHSHASGYNAQAVHDESFVWSDGAHFASQGVHTFSINASGGVHISGGDLNVYGKLNASELVTDSIIVSGGVNVVGGISGTAFYGDGANLLNVANLFNVADEGTGAKIGDVSSNSVAGNFGIASGENATAQHNNTFVWSDGANLVSQGNDTFTVHASGGVFLSGGPVNIEGVLTAGTISTTGNISGASFYGDASNLINLPVTVTSVDGLSGGIVDGNISATGTISGSAFYGDGSNISNLAGGNVSGNLTIAGDLVVQGTHTIVDTAELTVDDALITLNAGLTGAITPTEDTGLEAKRGNQPDAKIIFNETTDKWQAGISGDVNDIAVFDASGNLGTVGSVSGSFSGDGSNLTNLGMDNVTDEISGAQSGVRVGEIASLVATGEDALAMGKNASATDDNSFVWSDGAQVVSQGVGSFTVSASGGVHISGGGLFLNGNQVAFVGFGSGGANIFDEGTGTRIGDITQNVASGNYSVAEGNNTTAIGNMAHAEGAYTTAFGWHSHSEGYQTTAVGLNAHSEGKFTTAYGLASHAEGHQTLAYGIYSHASGEGARAQHANSFVWSDSTYHVSQGIQTFNVYASGGSHFNGGDLFLNGQSITETIDAVTAALNGTYVDENVGDNSNTTFTITHNLDTENVYVSLKDNGTNELAIPSVIILNNNSIQLNFGVAPTTDQYTVLVTGSLSGTLITGGGGSDFVGVENLGVNGSNVTLDTFLEGDADACEWIISVKSGLNLKAYKILATWDGAGNVSYHQTSTNEVGTVDNVTFSVVEELNNIRLKVTTAQAWDIKTKRVSV